MESGKVVNWNAVKGYGFIAPARGGRDIFLHASELSAGTISDQITPGAMVEFDTVQAEKGLKAVRVRLLGSVPPAPAPEGEADWLQAEMFRAELETIADRHRYAMVEDLIELARGHGWVQ